MGYLSVSVVQQNTFIGFKNYKSVSIGSYKNTYKGFLVVAFNGVFL